MSQAIFHQMRGVYDHEVSHLFERGLESRVVADRLEAPWLLGRIYRAEGTESIIGDSDDLHRETASRGSAVRLRSREDRSCWCTYILTRSHALDYLPVLDH